MIKIVLFILSFTGTCLFGMEKQEPKFLMWEQLLPEIKNEILVSGSIGQAMDRLRNARFVNKEFYNLIMKDNNALFNLLNVLHKKFPGSESAIARHIAQLVDKKTAEKWLKKINPTATLAFTSKGQVFNAMLYLGVNDLSSVKKWLQEGNNPLEPYMSGWTAASIAAGYGSISALNLMYNYNPDTFRVNNLKKLLFSTIENIYLLRLGKVNESFKPKLNRTRKFLQHKLKEQVTQEEAKVIIGTIANQVEQHVSGIISTQQ